MTLSMYQISIPVFTRVLTNLSAILNKAAAHAEVKKIDPSVFVNSRLAPDMFPLFRQIQIASDAVKSCAARLAGIDIPSFPDTESTIPELLDRITKTLEFLKTMNADQINGSENRSVTIKLRGKDVQFQGLPYLTEFVLPNLYFHVTTSYAILRHNGVDLGKTDYLGFV